MPKSSQPPANVPLTIVQGKIVVERYPTPNLSDRVYVRRMDARVEKNKIPPAVGSVYDGPDPKQLEGFVFATAKPADQGGFVDWYYLNERANQDAYNFAVDYPYADKTYPRITRTYVLLRDGLVEPQVNTVDPIYAGLQLTDHKQLRIDNDPVLDSLFVVVQRVYEILPGPVITTKQENQFQQLVTVMEQEVADPSTVTTPTAVTEIAKTERSGSAKLKVTRGDTDDVFGQEEYTIERNESLIPYRFLSLVPAIKFSQVVAGIASLPSLAATQWRASEKQLTKYKKLVETISHALTSAVTLIGYLWTRDQQIDTVTETWSPDQQTITPRATLIDAQVDNWGDAGSFKKEVEVPRVFPESEFSIDVQDPVPPEFQFISPTTRIGITEPGIAQLPTLGAGETAKREIQKTELIKRTEVTGRDLSQLPVTLVNQELTEAFGFGGVLDVARMLDKVPQTVDEGILVTASSVRNLPGGLTLKETSQIAGGDAHIDITNGGSGYTTPPAISFSGGTTAGGGAATAAVSSLAPPDPYTTQLDYIYDGDTRGVFFYLGSYDNNGVWRNPNTAGNITLSLTAGTLAQGDLTSIVDRQPSNTYTVTTDTAFELVVDLGSNKNLVCNKFAFRQRKDYNGNVEAFVFSGSNDGSTWVVLKSPPDTQLPLPHDQWKSYTIPGSTAYRYFRLSRPGVGPTDFTIGEIELYGALEITPGSVGVELTGITVTAPGVYASAPTVVISGGGGSGATATAVLNSDGSIRSVIVNTRGTGFTSAPTISFTGGTGSAGAATAVLGFAVTSVSVSAGGSGYSYPPAVVLTPDPDDDLAGGALAVAILSNGLGSIRVTNSGAGYTSTPTVALSGGGGSGATATAVRGFPLATIAVGTSGFGYTTPPTVVITGDGIGARARVAFGSVLTTPVITNPGSGYTSDPTVVFTGGGGTGAAATVTRSFGIASITLTAPGSGYTSNPAVALSGGGGTGARATAVRSFGAASANVTAGGSAYTAATVAFAAPPGAGTTATGTATVASGAVTAIVITDAGSGYLTAPAATISGDGTGATATAVLATSGPVDSFNITNAGSGYTSAPTVAITGGGGSGAEGDTVVSTAGRIQSLTMTNFGAGYTSTPAISFTGGAGTGAAAVTSLGASSGEIASIIIDDPGSGYTAAPAISFTGGDGSGATATSTLSTTGTIKSVTVSAAGSGYTSAPTVAFSGGGGGTGAAALASVAAGGTVAAVTITHGGAKYKTAPAVSFVPGGSGGTGAVATAHLAATGSVISATLTSPGVYATAPTLTFSGGGGTGAAGVYVFTVGWPVLYETRVDENTGIVVNIRKEMVAAGTKYSGFGFEEIQALDKWRSIRLTSAVDYSTLPQPEIYSDWQEFTFPDELLSIEAEWNASSGQTRAGQNYDGTFQTVSDAASTSGGAAVLVKHGYRGFCRAEVTRSYVIGPPTCCNLAEPLLIHESSGSVIVSGSSSSATTQTRPTSPFTVVGSTEPPPLSATTAVGTTTGIIPVGPVLTGSYVVLGANQAGGSLIVRIPVSEPVSFEPGFIFVSKVTVTKMRFQVWMIEVTRLTVPPGDCNCYPAGPITGVADNGITSTALTSGDSYTVP